MSSRRHRQVVHKHQGSGPTTCECVAHQRTQLVAVCLWLRGQQKRPNKTHLHIASQEHREQLEDWAMLRVRLQLLHRRRVQHVELEGLWGTDEVRGRLLFPNRTTTLSS